MPTYLPARLGVTYSEAIAESMASATIGDPLLITLEIHNENFRDAQGNPTAARVVNDYRPLRATLEADAPLNAGEEVTFSPVPFRYVAPPQTDGGAPSAVQVEVDNVSQTLTTLLLQAGRSKVQLIEREYLPSDTSAPHVMPPTRLTLSNVKAGVTTVSAQAGFGNLTNRRFPGNTYTRELFPALAAR